MKRLIASFFGVTFLLVIIQISVLYFVSLTTGQPFAQVLGQNTIYDVRSVQIGNQTQIFYLFNIKRYANSIKDSITVNLTAFNFKVPEMPNNDFSGVEQALKTIVNYLSYVVNWFIFITNITIILPTKLLLTPIIFLIAVLGIDVSNVATLDLITKIYSWTIGYIPPLT